jgi:hypothetical protein
MLPFLKESEVSLGSSSRSRSGLSRRDLSRINPRRQAYYRSPHCDFCSGPGSEVRAGFGMVRSSRWTGSDWPSPKLCLRMASPPSIASAAAGDRDHPYRPRRSALPGTPNPPSAPASPSPADASCRRSDRAGAKQILFTRGARALLRKSQAYRAPLTTLPHRRLENAL